MRTFEPKSIARSRGQILYRYRQGQTYDHGNVIAHVVGYANDDALQEPKIDDRQLVEEAMRFVLTAGLGHAAARCHDRTSHADDGLLYVGHVSVAASEVEAVLRDASALLDEEPPDAWTRAPALARLASPALVLRVGARAATPPRDSQSKRS